MCRQRSSGQAGRLLNAGSPIANVGNCIPPNEKPCTNHAAAIEYVHVPERGVATLGSMDAPRLESPGERQNAADDLAGHWIDRHHDRGRFQQQLRRLLLFDYKASILDNLTIRKLWPIGTVLHPPEHCETVTGRPLLNLSLAINYAISGSETWSYHAANLAIHVLAALLLFGILRRTLLLPGMREMWARPPRRWPSPSPLLVGRPSAPHRVGDLCCPTGRVSDGAVLPADILLFYPRQRQSPLAGHRPQVRQERGRSGTFGRPWPACSAWPPRN